MFGSMQRFLRKIRCPKRKKDKPTSEKNKLYLQGFFGHFWHLWKPQDVPMVPQHCSCLVRPGKAFPHWNIEMYIEWESKKGMEKELLFLKKCFCIVCFLCVSDPPGVTHTSSTLNQMAHIQIGTLHLSILLAYSSLCAFVLILAQRVLDVFLSIFSYDTCHSLCTHRQKNMLFYS